MQLACLEDITFTFYKHCAIKKIDLVILTFVMMSSQSPNRDYVERQPPPHFLLPNIMLGGLGYPFGEFGSAIPVVSPPSPLLGGRETEKALMLHEHSSAIAKTLVCYKHVFSYKSENTKSYRLL